MIAAQQFHPVSQLVLGMGGDRLHLSILLNSLRILTLEDKWLSSEEYNTIIINSARASVTSATPLEMAAISALIMDCFLMSTPATDDSGLFSFKIKDKTVNKAESIRIVNQYLQRKVGQNMSPALIDFHDQVMRDREFNATPEPRQPAYPPFMAPSISMGGLMGLGPSMNNSMSNNKMYNQSNLLPQSSSMHLQQQIRSSNRFPSYEHHPPQLSMVRLLALVRKQGMDILFPQYVHDKVLACIFVAIRIHGALAHRELIDLVMTTRDTRALKVMHMESVTKTKVRGVLALLKHATVLETCGTEGQPVQLSLNAAVNTFLALRNAHDEFLTVFCSPSGVIPLSSGHWEEITWAVDMKNPLTKNKYVYRLEEMNKFVAHLENYFSTFVAGSVLPHISSAADTRGYTEHGSLKELSHKSLPFQPLLTSRSMEQQQQQQQQQQQYPSAKSGYPSFYSVDNSDLFGDYLRSDADLFFNTKQIDLDSPGSAPIFQTGSAPPYQTGSAPPYQTGSAPPYQTGSAPPYQTGSAPPYQTGSAPPYQTGSAPPYQTGSAPPFQSYAIPSRAPNSYSEFQRAIGPSSRNNSELPKLRDSPPDDFVPSRSSSLSIGDVYGTPTLGLLTTSSSSFALEPQEFAETSFNAAIISPSHPPQPREPESSRESSNSRIKPSSVGRKIVDAIDMVELPSSAAATTSSAGTDETQPIGAVQIQPTVVPAPSMMRSMFSKLASNFMIDAFPAMLLEDVSSHASSDHSSRNSMKSMDDYRAAPVRSKVQAAGEFKLPTEKQEQLDT